MLLQIVYYSKGLLQQHNIDMKDFLRAKMSQIDGKIDLRIILSTFVATDIYALFKSC